MEVDHVGKELHRQIRALGLDEVGIGALPFFRYGTLSRTVFSILLLRGRGGRTGRRSSFGATGRAGLSSFVSKVRQFSFPLVFGVDVRKRRDGCYCFSRQGSFVGGDCAADMAVCGGTKGFLLLADTASAQGVEALFFNASRACRKDRCARARVSSRRGRHRGRVAAGSVRSSARSKDSRAVGRHARGSTGTSVKGVAGGQLGGSTRRGRSEALFATDLGKQRSRDSEGAAGRRRDGLSFDPALLLGDRRRRRRRRPRERTPVGRSTGLVELLRSGRISDHQTSFEATEIKSAFVGELAFAGNGELAHEVDGGAATS